MKKFIGTGVAIVTPFKDDLEVDHDALKRIVNHLIDGGVDYLVPMGTTGETATLTEEEILSCMATVMETNNGRVPVLMGCGGNNTRVVASKMEKYQKTIQPDGFLSVSPYYNKPSQDGIYQHYRSLSASSSIPIMLYNVPGRTGSNILPETVVKIANDCTNVVAIKEASGNIEQQMELKRIKPANLSLISGDDSMTLPLIACGYEGVVSVAANARPRDFSQMVKYCLANEWDKARELHYRLLRWMGLNFKEGSPAGIKSGMELLGLCKRHVRQPLAGISNSLIEEMRQELQLAK